MSDTKTKVGPLGILLTAALAAVVIFIVLPALKKTVTEDDAPVTITITFTPSPRSGQVPPNRTLRDVIIVEIEMKPEQTKREVTESGWTEVRTPVRGQRLWVKASQAYGDTIECLLTRNGQKVDSNKNTGARPAICAFTPR